MARSRATTVTMARLTLTSALDPDLRPWHLCVDGMSPTGPNLSHWPGNRTPRELKADLSTGICLRFARSSAADQARVLAGATQVLNNHYDTDGFLSLLAVTRPEVALAREEVCLAAAATGDYSVFTTRRGFAIDRIVLNLGKRPGTPLYGELDAQPQAARDYARYRWLLDHAEAVLDAPERLTPLFEAELDDTLRALDAAQAGALQRDLFHAEGIAVLTSATDLSRIVLNTLSVLHRVLHVRAAPSGGHCFRLHERTESWFEMVTIQPPARLDLRPLAARLQALEGARGEAGAGVWNADAPDDPIPELYFGAPGPQAYGEVTRSLAASRLTPAQVIDAVRAFYAAIQPGAPRDAPLPAALL